MNPTVTILLSDKRSGSTMLQDEQCKHPDIPHVAYTPHKYFETQNWIFGASLLKRPKQDFFWRQALLWLTPGCQRAID